jgi:CRP-like cAMP-binding protein
LDVSLSRIVTRQGEHQVSFVESAVNDIDSRLRELNDEVARLQAARDALTGSGASQPRPRRATVRTGRSARTSSRRSSGQRSSGQRASGQRARRGGNTRSNQALDLVRKQPGITIPQIAESLGIEPNYLYRVMPRLVSEGLVTRDGQGWHSVADGS